MPLHLRDRQLTPCRRARLGAVVLLAFGCSGAPAAVAPSPDFAAAAGAESPATQVEDLEVAVRLGCDVVTRTQVVAEAERAAGGLEPAGNTPGDDEDIDGGSDPRLTEAADRLVRRVIVRREAERLGIAVTPEETERAVASLLRHNAWDSQDLQQSLDERSQTMEGYRAELANQLLEYKVVVYAQDAHVEVTEDEVRAEYERMVADVAPAPVRSFEEAREDIRDRLLATRWQQETDARFARVRRWLEALPVRAENGACVEEWPQHPFSELSFDGNSALDDDELRGLAASAVTGDGTTWTVPDLPRIVVMLKAAYFDLGYAEVAIRDEDAPNGCVVFRIEEGGTFRIGEVRVVVRAADGTESDPAEDDASWRAPEHPATGELFCRREIGETLQSLEARFEDQWGVEHVATDVDLDVRDDGTVDLALVVRRP